MQFINLMLSLFIIKVAGALMYCVLRYLAAVMIHQAATTNLNLELGLLDKRAMYKYQAFALFDIF